MGMNLFNTNETIMKEENEKVFVDDANLVVNEPYPQILVQTKSQQKENLIASPELNWVPNSKSPP